MHSGFLNRELNGRGLRSDSRSGQHIFSLKSKQQRQCNLVTDYGVLSHGVATDHLNITLRRASAIQYLQCAYIFLFSYAQDFLNS